MKKIVISILLIMIALGIVLILWSKSIKTTEKKLIEIVGSPSPQSINSKEFFNLSSLNQDIVFFANAAYQNADASNTNPDYYDGIPPFNFFKRVDCQVVYADPKTEKIIKKYPETVTFHTIVLLKDSQNNLFDFTLTSTSDDKAILRLQHYGPLTDENPSTVNLPINERRLNNFPIDFKTKKVLEDKDGQCVYLPYPIIGDQAFWLLGNDLKNSSLQGLYRNDNIKNISEYFNQIKRNFERNSN